MPDFSVLEPSIDPNNRISFLLDWELTMKCNLDCSYCNTGTYGGHDNTTKHPPLEECLQTVEFMYKYVDLYMQHKPKGIKYVILNVYGGESLYHPGIEVILKACRDAYQEYADKWHLTITTTTNLIVPEKKLMNILPYIDEFTVSYHSEASNKQKETFKKNLLTIIDNKKRAKCVVLMHADEKLFEDSQNMINWLTQHNIKYLPRQLDHPQDKTFLNYNTKQVKWFDNLYSEKSYKEKPTVKFKQVENKFDLSDSGRACCGGRQLCKDFNQKSRIFYVENTFPDWYCSVNEFFVYIKQLTKEIFVNKDCKMNFDGSVSPIGTIDNYQQLLNFTKTNLENNSMPKIQCKKERCFCGLCAPKAENEKDFDKMMRKYRR